MYINLTEIENQDLKYDNSVLNTRIKSLEEVVERLKSALYCRGANVEYCVIEHLFVKPISSPNRNWINRIMVVEPFVDGHFRTSGEIKHRMEISYQ